MGLKYALKKEENMFNYFCKNSLFSLLLLTVFVADMSAMNHYRTLLAAAQLPKSNMQQTVLKQGALHSLLHKKQSALSSSAIQSVKNAHNGDYSKSLRPQQRENELQYIIDNLKRLDSLDVFSQFDLCEKARAFVRCSSINEREKILQVLPNVYKDLSSMRDGRRFLSELCHYIDGFNAVSPLITDQFADELRSTEKIWTDGKNSALAHILDAHSNVIDWGALSVNHSDSYQNLLNIMLSGYHLGLYPSAKRNILMYAPEKDRIPLIKYILAFRFFDPSSEQCIRSAYLIADCIILFNLDLDIYAHAANKEFADAIIQAKSDLHASYNYHIEHPINDNTSVLRTWLKHELGDEFKRTIDLGLQKADYTPNARISAQSKDLRRSLDTHAASYVSQKFKKLGFNLEGRIFVDKSPFKNADITYSSEKIHKVIVNNGLLNQSDSLENNTTLGHEIMHFNDNHAHPAFNSLKGEDLSYIEKAADIYGSLLAGPESCRRFALCHADGPEFANIRDHQHAPNPVRGAALARLARVMEAEDAGQPFDPDKEIAMRSPLALWIASKCKHPDQEEFRQRFYRNGTLNEISL